jgi:hypothetical protein
MGMSRRRGGVPLDGWALSGTQRSTRRPPATPAVLLHCHPPSWRRRRAWRQAPRSLHDAGAPRERSSTACAAGCPAAAGLGVLAVSRAPWLLPGVGTLRRARHGEATEQPGGAGVPWAPRRRPACHARSRGRLAATSWATGRRSRQAARARVRCRGHAPGAPAALTAPRLGAAPSERANSGVESAGRAGGCARLDLAPRWRARCCCCCAKVAAELQVVVAGGRGTRAGSGGAAPRAGRWAGDVPRCSGRARARGGAGALADSLAARRVRAAAVEAGAVPLAGAGVDAVAHCVGASAGGWRGGAAGGAPARRPLS